MVIPVNELHDPPAETRLFGVIPKHVLKGEGVQCFNCGKFAKARASVIDKTMARGLILMAGELGRRVPGGWVHFPSLPVEFLKSKTLSQAQHWKLIEEREKRSGWWRLTADGMRFVLNGASIMKTAWVYNKQVLEYQGPPVTIRESVGRSFDYEALLHESGYRGH